MTNSTTSHGSSKRLKQNIRLITGRVLNDNEICKGTCFVYDQIPEPEQIFLITSYSVVDEILNGDVIEGKSVQVYFPQIKDKDLRPRTAEIFRFYIDRDIALLRLHGKTIPIPRELKIAEVSTLSVSNSRDSSKKSRFLSYGFNEDNDYHELPIRGKIIGQYQNDKYLFEIEKPKDVSLAGMAGAPVLDWDLDLVIGMITIPHSDSRIKKDNDPENHHIEYALAVDLAVLAEDRLVGEHARQKFQMKYTLPKYDEPSRLTHTSNIIAGQAQTKHDEYELKRAPRIDHGLPVLRSELIEDLAKDWKRRFHHVIGLIGPQGSGKSTIARQFINYLEDIGNMPDAIFWWDFNDFPSVSDFIDTALVYFLGKDKIKELQLQYGDEFIPLEVLGLIISNGKILFVFNGFENVLEQENKDKFGLLRDDRDQLAYLLDIFTIGVEHNSMCLILSNISIINLIDRRSYYERRIFPLGDKDTILLLEHLGLPRDKNWMMQLGHAVHGHALSMVLTAGLGKYNEHDVARITGEVPRVGGKATTLVASLMRFFSEQLADEDRFFLDFISIFRIPVSIEGIEHIFKTVLPFAIRQPGIVSMDIEQSINHFIENQILISNENEEFSLHQLVIEYFRNRFKDNQPELYGKAQETAGLYFAELADEIETDQSVRKMFIGEAVHHFNLDDNDEALKNLDTNSRLLDKNWWLLHPIGKGGFGVVYHAYDAREKRNVAVKVISDGEGSINSASLTVDRIRSIKDEIEILKKLQHPHIIQIYGYGFEPEIYIAMPFYRGGSLKERIKNGDVMQLKMIIENIIVPIGEALFAAYRKGIVHRDVSTGNILFNSQDAPYLIDFGLALSSGGGTPGYVAPESVRTEKGDQYSLAVITLELLTGETAKSISEKVKSNLINEFIDVSPIVKEFKPILQTALSINPKDRYETINEFIEALKKAYWTHVIRTDATIPIEGALLDSIADTTPNVGDKKSSSDTNSQISSQGDKSTEVPSNHDIENNAYQANINKVSDEKVDSTGQFEQDVTVQNPNLGMQVVELSNKDSVSRPSRIYPLHKSTLQRGRWSLAGSVAIIGFLISTIFVASEVFVLLQNNQTAQTETAIAVSIAQTPSNTPTGTPSSTPSSTPTGTPSSTPTVLDTLASIPTPIIVVGIELPIIEGEITIDRALQKLNTATGLFELDCPDFHEAYAMFYLLTDELQPDVRDYIDNGLNTTTPRGILTEILVLCGQSDDVIDPSGIRAQLSNFVAGLNGLLED